MVKIRTDWQVRCRSLVDVHSGDKCHFFSCQGCGCIGLRSSLCLFLFTPGLFGGTVETFCWGKQNVAGAGFCRDERLPAGKVHYFATLHVSCGLGVNRFFFFLFICLEKLSRQAQILGHNLVWVPDGGKENSGCCFWGAGEMTNVTASQQGAMQNLWLPVYL